MVFYHELSETHVFEASCIVRIQHVVEESAVQTYHEEHYEHPEKKNTLHVSGLMKLSKDHLFTTIFHQSVVLVVPPCVYKYVGW